MPATGQLKHLQFPTENAHIRIDTGVRQGDAVSIHYDPMIAKLIVWDENRSAALRRMHLALRELQIVGLTNNVDFLDRIICHPSFASGNFDTSFIEQYNDELFNESDRDTTQMLSLATLFLQVQRKHAAIQSNPLDATSPWALTDNWRLNQTNFETMNFSCSDDLLSVGITHHNGGYSLQLPNDVTVGASASIHANGQLSAFIDGQKINASIIKNNQALHIFTDAATYQLTAIEDHGMSIDEDDEKGGLTAPMPGTIIDVLVADGDEVSEGQTLILLEAMKMEHAIKAPADGVIESVRFKTGDMVEEGVALIEMAS